MSRLVLIVVAAAWAAVLLPPLLRSRMESRPDTSVSSFRRQLTSLQRATPGGMAPMRSMARPLAGSPRPGYAARPVPQARRGQVSTLHRYDLAAERRPARAHYASPVRPVSAVKQRRQNILMALGLVTLGSGLLSLTTEAMTVRYVFALSVCLLVGYVYLLIQTKRADDARTVRDYWQHAA